MERAFHCYPQFEVIKLAHRFPLVHVDIYVPPTATYLQYRIIGLTPMAVGLSQSLAKQSGTVSRISSGTRQSALTLSDVYWRCICLRDTSACSTLEVDNFMRYVNLLTYLFTYNTDLTPGIEDVLLLQSLRTWSGTLVTVVDYKIAQTFNFQIELNWKSVDSINTDLRNVGCYQTHCRWKLFYF